MSIIFNIAGIVFLVISGLILTPQLFSKPYTKLEKKGLLKIMEEIKKTDSIDITKNKANKNFGAITGILSEMTADDFISCINGVKNARFGIIALLGGSLLQGISAFLH